MLSTKKREHKKHASYNLLTIKDIRLRKKKKNCKMRKKMKKERADENAIKNERKCVGT